MRTGVVFATEAPTIAISSMTFASTETTLNVNEVKSIRLNTDPAQANSPEITYTSNDTGVVTVSKVSEKEIKLTGVSSGTTTITATAGSVTATLNVTVAGDTVSTTNTVSPTNRELLKDESLEKTTTKSTKSSTK